MLASLDDLPTLRRRSRRTRWIATWLASIAVVPLALGLGFVSAGMAPRLSMLLHLLLGPCVGATAGWWTGARHPDRRPVRMIFGAIASGLVYVALYAWLLAWVSSDRHAPDWLAVVIAGSIASGLAFVVHTAMHWLAMRCARVEMTRVAHDQPARVARSLGRMLLVVAALCALASILLGDLYRGLVARGLGELVGVSAAGLMWTRVPLAAAAPLAGAIALTLSARREAGAIGRLARALQRGEHPTWVLEAAAPNAGALPLRAIDASTVDAGTVRRRRDADSYRDAALDEPLALLARAEVTER